MKVWGLGCGYKTINVDGSSSSDKQSVRISDVLALFSETLLFRIVAPDAWRERILVVADGMEVKHDAIDGSHVVAMQRWSTIGMERCKVSCGRMSIDFPFSRSIQDLGVELYVRGACTIIPVEQRIIINGKSMDKHKHVLIGDVALFCTGSKLNVTIVRATGNIICREASEASKNSRDSSFLGLQKMPKRKRSCTDGFRGLGPSRQRVTPHASLKSVVASPPVTPVK